MSDVKLKPCPFCGSDTPEIQQESAEWFVACSHVDECGAEGHRALVDDYAIERWNARSHDARLIEALEPFAEFARASSFDKLPDDIPLTNGSPMARKQVTAADFRRARSTIAQAREDRQ